MYEYKKRPSKFKKVLVLILLIVVVSATSMYIYDMYAKIDIYSYEQSNNNAATRLSGTATSENSEEVEIVQKIEEITKCIVGISKIKNTGNSIFLNTSTSDLGLGTGIIVSENGYIVTNWHVAGNKYSNCYITLENGTMHNGNVVWADSDLDLAIIKISASGLKYVNLGDSDNIKLGEKSYAIGNPIGVEFQRTVTSGIISGINRTVRLVEEEKELYMEDLIQTDATINPGNSGGPLINNKGEVIGINSVKINNAEGIGFAIPINIIKPIIAKYATTGEFEEAYLGLFAYDKNIIPYLSSNIEFDNGIYIAQISADGPCYNSGLKIGDIITKIDDSRVNKMSDLREYIYNKNPNDKVLLNILRSGKEHIINVTLQKKF